MRSVFFFWVVMVGCVVQAKMSLTPVSQCLRETLAHVSLREPSIFDRDGFALMDPHSGHVLWVKGRQNLSQFAYQPASLFKLVTAYALLSRTDFDPMRTFFCKPAAALPVGHKPCWYAPGHGLVNLTKALAYSCNQYFRHMSALLPAAQIVQTAREFGLGRSTQSDFSGEISGSLPREVSIQEAPALALGQEKDTLVTGLQILSMIGAIANGGVLYSPRKNWQSGSEPYQRGVLEHPSHLRLLRQAMEQSAAYGTVSKNLSDLGVAGKTGTAGWRKIPWRTHGWFMGMWPARNPMLVLVVFVFEGQGANQSSRLAGSVLREAIAALRKCQGDAT